MDVKNPENEGVVDANRQATAASSFLDQTTNTTKLPVSIMDACPLDHAVFYAMRVDAGPATLELDGSSGDGNPTEWMNAFLRQSACWDNAITPLADYSQSCQGFPCMTATELPLRE